MTRLEPVEARVRSSVSETVVTIEAIPRKAGLTSVGETEADFGLVSPRRGREFDG